jgi:peroxiredoxin
MARTESRMLALGTPAPAFELVDVTSGGTVGLDDVAGPRGLLVMFICAHCPYVIHVQDELARVGRDYAARGIGTVAISSNDAEAYPADAPERLAEQARTVGFSFPYLHDASQEVARAYDAACTPDLFLFDAARRLVYRGQLDGSRPSNGQPVTGEDLRRALDAVVAGAPVPAEQRPSLGCNVKWRAPA